MATPIEIVEEWVKAEIKRCDRTNFDRFRYLGEIKGVVDVAKRIGKPRYNGMRSKIGEWYVNDEITPAGYLQLLKLVGEVEKD